MIIFQIGKGIDIDQKNKAGRKPVRKNVSETAKVLKITPVVQKCFFVPLEL